MNSLIKCLWISHVFWRHDTLIRTWKKSNSIWNNEVLSLSILWVEFKHNQLYRKRWSINLVSSIEGNLIMDLSILKIWLTSPKYEVQLLCSKGRAFPIGECRSTLNLTVNTFAKDWKRSCPTLEIEIEVAIDCRAKNNAI